MHTCIYVHTGKCKDSTVLESCTHQLLYNHTCASLRWFLDENAQPIPTQFVADHHEAW